VTAVNEKGDEGYHSKDPFFVQTMKQKINNCDSLFVWGYNGQNELGLPDNEITENQADYVKQSMTKPVFSPMFNGFTY
jgi:alpha-tubulin suppressor-like RCC1 family protein